MYTPMSYTILHQAQRMLIITGNIADIILISCQRSHNQKWYSPGPKQLQCYLFLYLLCISCPMDLQCPIKAVTINQSISTWIVPALQARSLERVYLLRDIRYAVTGRSHGDHFSVIDLLTSFDGGHIHQGPGFGNSRMAWTGLQ